MSRKTKLRLASLILLLIALVFLFCAVSCPTLGRVFYRLYAAVIIGLFLLSFLVRERKTPQDR